MTRSQKVSLGKYDWPATCCVTSRRVRQLRQTPPPAKFARPFRPPTLASVVLPPLLSAMSTNFRCLTALPVYNEVGNLTEVLDKVARYAGDILVVDDGSTDGSGELLEQRTDIALMRHCQNQGYGAALCTAFDYAMEHGYDVLVTIDCDGQHEPQLIGHLASQIFATPADGEVAEQPADIISGSRYLDTQQATVGAAPADRRQINQTITRELNKRLGLDLTDAFCGFKAYRVDALRRLRLAELGYAMPLELWVQAAHHQLVIREAAVPLIYLDEERSFGGALDQAEQRLAYYRSVIARALAAASRPAELPRIAACSIATAADAVESSIDAYRTSC
ncbi:MAG: glycosyltransferase family 2 protein [Planctomycetota bacterium]